MPQNLYLEKLVGLETRDVVLRTNVCWSLMVNVNLKKTLEERMNFYLLVKFWGIQTVG